MKTCNLVIGALLLFILFSCKKEGVTSYQIVNNIDEEFFKRIVPFDDPYLDGTFWEVIVLCYDKPGNLVDIDTLNPVDPNGGTSLKIETVPECAKVKPTFKLLPSRSVNYELAVRVFLYDFTVLEEGKNTQIIIDGVTRVSTELTNMNNSFSPVTRHSSPVTLSKPPAGLLLKQVPF